MKHYKGEQSKMLKEIQIYFLLFFIYSVLGWCMEVLSTFRVEKKFVNRGFLIGPYCPIYGFGVLLITLLLKKYVNDIVVTFIFSILICAILEYLTSYILEKIFYARWWDYSNRKFNINGRVCLGNLLIFGILGCFIIYISNPFLITILKKVPNFVLNIISIILLIGYITDTVISSNVIIDLKDVSKTLNKDHTEEISEKVKRIIQSKFTLQRRLLKAFPNIRNTINFEELIEKAKKKIKKIKEK